MPNKGNRHKGFCEKCLIAYSWQGGPMLKNARCPKCGTALVWTSWATGGVWKELKECG